MKPIFDTFKRGVRKYLHKTKSKIRGTSNKVKGFGQGIKTTHQDFTRLTKALEKSVPLKTGKFTVDASPEVKSFVHKELSGVKKDLMDKLEDQIKPKHLFGATVMGGVGLGIGMKGADYALSKLPMSRTQTNGVANDDFKQRFEGTIRPQNPWE